MPRRTTLEDLSGELAAGERIYLPGSAGEPNGLVEALFTGPEGAQSLDVTTSAVPGINPLPLRRFRPDVTVSGLFMQPDFAEAQRAGRYRHLPLSYSAFVRHLRDGPGFDTCIVHVAPPGPDGRCSLGVAVEFTPIAAARSRRLIAVVNPRMPRIPGAEAIAYADFDLVVENDAPLRAYEVGPATAEAQRIAAGVAAFIDDGASLQVGLGKIPEALFACLHDRRGLRLHSGMLSDSTMALAASGALDAAHRPTTCVLVGTPSLYAWAGGRDDIDVRNCGVTHDVSTLTSIRGLVAVNSALTVDLFGQSNLEVAGRATVSGVGGAADFARAARHSAGGISIVALPATFARGTQSRIVPRLGAGLASLPRSDVDVVVTEEGSADLRGRSVHERAAALIDIAAPAHRAALSDEWREIAGDL